MSEKRSAFLMFMNTTPSTDATYGLIGDGVTELSVAYNPQTTTEQFIHQDVANTEITGYQPNAPVTAQAVKGDAVFDYINGLRKKLPIGKDAYTDVVYLDVFEEKVESKGYPATKQPVSIQIDSYGGAATDPLSIGYTINWRGDPKEGHFDPEKKTFTDAEAIALSMDSRKPVMSVSSSKASKDSVEV